MKRIILIGDAKPGSGPASRKNNFINCMQQSSKKVDVLEITSLFIGIKCFFRSGKKTKTIIITYTHDLVTMFFVFCNIVCKYTHVHMVHGDFYAEQDAKRGIKKLLWVPVNERLCSKSNYIVMVSEWLKKRLTKSGNIALEKITVIPNAYLFSPIDEHVVHHDNIQKVIRCLTITGFTHFEKGRGVIDLAMMLKDIPIAVDFTVVGGGRYLASLKKSMPPDNTHFAIREKSVSKFYFENMP